MSGRGRNRERHSGVRIDDRDRGRYLSTPEPSASPIVFPARFGLDPSCCAPTANPLPPRCASLVTNPVTNGHIITVSVAGLAQRKCSIRIGAAYPSGLRERTANPRCGGSNPPAASILPRFLTAALSRAVVSFVCTPPSGGHGTSPNRPLRGVSVGADPEAVQIAWSSSSVRSGWRKKARRRRRSPASLDYRDRRCDIGSRVGLV